MNKQIKTFLEKKQEANPTFYPKLGFAIGLVVGVSVAIFITSNSTTVIETVNIVDTMVSA